jgi:hypothetical protein
LNIVEIYASVPVKFANDGNGKKALWRKSLNDTVKKLMTNKDNTLSASQLRNPVYKNHIGLFTSDELYNPDMMSSADDEESISESMSREVGKLRVGSNFETSSPMHEMASGTSITPMDAEEKQNIKNRLERMFGHSNV